MPPHRRPARRRSSAEPLEPRRLLTAIPGFAETVVTAGINRAVQMDFAPDGRLFVTQQDGNLRVVKNGQLLAQPFLTVPVHNTGESGLIGITFDPDFASNAFVYVYYTYKDPTGAFWNRVSRFTAAGDAAVPGSETILLEGDVLGPGTWHNAGGMQFGPDGMLYIGMGENQQPERSQELDTLLGKVLRIHPDGSIPADNPFYTTNTGKYRAIWAYGFRNPYTLDVQPGTGRIFVNDVGAAAWEEVNELERGANYGWPGSEGAAVLPGHKAPLYAYAHAGGDFDDSAITGAAFYNPPAATFPADYVGDFFFGDYGTGVVQRIDPASGAVATFGTNLIGVTDIDVGPDGAVYYLIRATSAGPDGRVVRVTPEAVGSPPSIAAQPLNQQVPAGAPATFAVAANGAGLAYQWSRNGAAIPGATAASYTLPATTLADDGSRFRVVVANANGTVASNEAVLTVLQDAAPVATILAPAAGTLWTGGGSIQFAGTGLDPEDGDLPASAFTWEVVFHHDTHTHPFIAPFTGVKSGTIPIPDVGETEPNTFYRVRLTVRDSAGVTHSAFQDVHPLKVNLAVRTEPAGLAVTLDHSPVPTPYAGTAVAGLRRSLGAAPTQVVDGVQYDFVGWSDGTPSAEREVTVQATDVEYVAQYRAATPVPVDPPAAPPAPVTPPPTTPPVPVTPPAPGPISVALRVTTPPAALRGERLSGKASVFVTNRSSQTVAGPVTTRLVLVRADAPETVVSEVAHVTKALTLAPGTAKTVKLGAAVTPNVPAGLYLLKAQVLASDGSPSLSAAGQPVTILQGTVDLAALQAEPAPGPQVPRRTETIKLVLQNRGQVTVRGPVVIRLLASADRSLDDGDVVLTQVLPSLNLAPGRTATLKVRLAYPANLPAGFYNLVAELDPNNVLGEAETERLNNVAVGLRSIQPAV